MFVAFGLLALDKPRPGPRRRRPWTIQVPSRGQISAARTRTERRFAGLVGIGVWINTLVSPKAENAVTVPYFCAFMGMWATCFARRRRGDLLRDAFLASAAPRPDFGRSTSRPRRSREPGPYVLVTLSPSRVRPLDDPARSRGVARLVSTDSPRRGRGVAATCLRRTCVAKVSLSGRGLEAQAVAPRDGVGRGGLRGRGRRPAGVRGGRADARHQLARRRHADDVTAGRMSRP